MKTYTSTHTLRACACAYDILQRCGLPLALTIVLLATPHIGFAESLGEGPSPEGTLDAEVTSPAPESTTSSAMNSTTEETSAELPDDVEVNGDVDERDEARARRISAPPAAPNVASEAVFQRPFLLRSRSAALGGYVEADATVTREEGVNSGLNLALRRFNLFIYSQISPRIQMLAELEFEIGGQEIKIETAQLDVQATDWLSLRVGVLLIPLGQFNQDHDAPRWPLIDRPLVSETLLPATLSEVGLGVIAQHSVGATTMDVQAYVTNGLSAAIVDSERGRTDIPAGKHEGLLHLDTNGYPAFSGRAGVMWHGASGTSVGGGLSAYHTIYNRFRDAGEAIDVAHRLTLAAIDVRAEVGRFELRGEAALAAITLPAGLTGLLADRQWGWHIDVYTTLFTQRLGHATQGRLRFVLRAEHVDYFAGSLANGDTAGLSTWGLTGGLAWEVGAQLVVRIGLRQRWERDFINNPPSRSIQAQLGVASYF